MGVFSKVLLAIAILVANGVLLFVILRFLLWLAFPGKRDEEAAVAAATPAAGVSWRRWHGPAGDALQRLPPEEQFRPGSHAGP